MTPEVERFLDLATRELESRPDMREEAKGELMARISHAGGPLETLDLSVPLGRLKKVRGRKSSLRRVAVLVAAIGLLVLTLVMVGVVVKDIVLSIQAQTMWYRSEPMSDEPPLGFVLFKQWLEKEAPGIPLKNGSDGELEMAIEKHPDDVALFQQKLLRKFEDARGGWTGLTPDERNKARDIDPENGFYDFIEIRGHFEHSMGGASFRRPTTKVVDEKAFEAALDAFARAAEAEVIHDASGALKRRQLEALPMSKMLMDELIAESLIDDIPSLHGLRHYYYSRFSLVEFQVDRLVAKGDPDGLLKLRDRALQISRKLTEDCAKGADPLVVASWINSNLTSIKKGLTDLGFHDEARELGEITYAVDGGSSGFNLRHQAWRGSSPSFRLSDWLDAPRDLTLEEVIPAGKVDRSAIQRYLALCGALIALIAILFTAIESYRRRRRVAGVAKGLMPLVDWRDRLWIAGLGLVLPWAWFLGITCLTPLGMRDLALKSNESMTVPILLIQSAAALVFAVVMLVWAGYWRWEKRGGFLAFHGGWMRLGLISGILTALTVPAVGLYRFFSFTTFEKAMFFFTGACGFAGIGILWLLWVTILNLFTPQANALRANVVMRTVLPWMLAGLATLLICAGAQWWSERYWYSKDTLFPNWTSKTHKNALEERVARDIREQIIELLD